MRNDLQIRHWLLTTALVFVCGTVAGAQYQYPGYEAPRWHLNGFGGFDITHTTQSTTPSATETSQLFPLGDLRLNSDGFLLDPKFLHLNAAFDYQKGANTSERGDLGTGGTNIAVSSIFLPRSHVPFRASYTKTNHGVTGLGLDQNDDNSRLDLQWSMLFPRLPQLNVSFQKYSNTVHVPSSFADRSSNDMAFNTGLSDSWKEWRWAGNFSIGSGNSTGVSQISLNSPFDNSTRAGAFHLSRGFWDNKARLSFENREVWRRDHLGGDGTSKSSELTNNANFNLQVTQHVSVDAGYGFSQLDFQGDGFGNVLVPGGGTVQVVSFASSTSNSVNGRVDYHPLDWLRFTEEVRTALFTPAAGVAESRTSFTEMASSIAANHRWRSLELSGAYTGRFQLSGTTLDHAPDSWSNSFNGRVGWGDARYVRLTAAAQDTHLNLVEQIGGFTDEKRLGMEVETHRIKFFRLRSSAEYSNVELLNISGNTRTKMTSFSLQADQRRFTVAFNKSFMDGAGALFPDGLIDRTFLVVPLPINALLATPLLNRTTHTQTVSLIGRPRRRLDVAVAWRKEDTRLVNSEQTFNILQADARYRLGKFSLEGGYSRNINDVTVVTGPSGTRLALWYFRIGRDFRVF
ncbi:MAG: hypothetical protein LAO20_15550 [Acidobacteriia bacterium]|nr:hypothetical protein [Terriglobia bacterium]